MSFIESAGGVRCEGIDSQFSSWSAPAQSPELEDPLFAEITSSPDWQARPGWRLCGQTWKFDHQASTQYTGTGSLAVTITRDKMITKLKLQLSRLVVIYVGSLEWGSATTHHPPQLLSSSLNCILYHRSLWSDLGILKMTFFILCIAVLYTNNTHYYIYYLYFKGQYMFYLIVL